MPPAAGPIASERRCAVAAHLRGGPSRSTSNRWPMRGPLALKVRQPLRLSPGSAERASPSLLAGGLLAAGLGGLCYPLTRHLSTRRRIHVIVQEDGTRGCCLAGDGERMLPRWRRRVLAYRLIDALPGGERLFDWYKVSFGGVRRFDLSQRGYLLREMP